MRENVKCKHAVEKADAIDKRRKADKHLADRIGSLSMNRPKLHSISTLMFFNFRNQVKSVWHDEKYDRREKMRHFMKECAGQIDQ